jgi:hypothetical protein
MLLFHSTHSTWLFDPEGKRFKRVPAGVDPEGPFASAPWEPYHDLVVDGDEFTVVLDDAGTLLLRAHTREAEVDLTIDDATQEIKLELDPID